MGYGGCTSTLIGMIVSGVSPFLNKHSKERGKNMNDFEKDYAAVKEIDNSYNESRNEKAKEQVRANYKVWADGIEAKGREYADAFRIYKNSRDNGNSRPNISEPYQTRDIPILIKAFRDNGITEFTYSSTWSSAVNVGWDFIQNGCELAGMVEVYSGLTKHFSDEKEIVPAYLFRIKQGG